MKQFNFLLREMTHLRYYVPILRELKNRGESSTFVVVPSNKYNCPTRYKNYLMSIFEHYNVDVSNDISNLGGYFFCNEDSGLDITRAAAKKCKVIVTTYQTDFTKCYKNYHDIAEHIMMPSENIAKYYQLTTSKNLYIGIPKYDTEFDKDDIVLKYKLNNEKKKVLIMWPKSRDIGKFPIDIIKNFDELGWQVLVKARAKDPISQRTIESLNRSGHLHFYDNWFPHTTQELLEVSDLVVNCGSTTIEECVMHEVPLINFDIKPSVRHGEKQKYRVTHDYLYNYDFCKNIKSLNKDFNTEVLQSYINDLGTSFSQCKKDWLYDHKNTCKNLLDMIF